MNLRSSWSARVGLAGSCLIWVGCGGSGVPDPESDAKAVGDAPMPVASASAPAEAAPQDAPAPAARAEAPAAEPAAAAQPEGAVAARTDEAPAPEGEKPAAKESHSATNDLFAAATAAPAPVAAAAEKPADGSGAAAPGAEAAQPGLAGGENVVMTPPPGIEAPLGGEGGGGGGGEADIGTPGNPIPSETFRSPWTAANAFLQALRAKDPDKLAQTTALRAPTEASIKYQKVFTAILEQSLAPEDLDELVKKFEGYSIISNNQPKSTGRFEVVVGRTKGTSQFHRTITLRKEKAGWKVCDVSGEREFERPIMIPNMRGGMGGGRR